MRRGAGRGECGLMIPRDIARGCSGAAAAASQRSDAAPPTGASGRAARADAAELATGVDAAVAVFGGIVTGYTLRAAGGIRPAPEGGAVPRPRVMRPAESHGAIVVTGFNILSSPRGRGGQRSRASTRSNFPSILLLTGRARRTSFLLRFWRRGAAARSSFSPERVMGRPFAFCRRSCRG